MVKEIYLTSLYLTQVKKVYIDISGVKKIAEVEREHPTFAKHNNLPSLRGTKQSQPLRKAYGIASLTA